MTRTITDPVRRRAKAALAVVALGMGAAVLSGCKTSTLARPTSPIVLTGAQLPTLVGIDPEGIVAFRHTTSGDVGTWTQIPMQVDERAVVAFGTQPSNNTSPGTTGTVYGNGSGGPTALQYTDPDTWVGADPNAAFDADDELVFMAFDAGGIPGEGAQPEPTGVVAGTGVQVQVTDPSANNKFGWVYLFEHDGTLSPAAGVDYVDYDFNLTSGDYKTTYKRADGPNPETSRVVTPSYEIGFTDRWKETSWEITAGDATGVDILDGNKNQFGTSTCGRSNQTFVDAEGAFVANIDGPVRAIRSYIGANSGPLTQRTHLLYRDREDVITDLRVHAIPAVMDFLDYSASASGMTYRSSTTLGGVTIDGVQDTVSAALPNWEAVDGPQGRVYTKGRVIASQANIVSGTTAFYEDRLTPSATECWGDGKYYGASGLWVQIGINNTDPRTSPFETFSAQRTNLFLPPAEDPSAIAADAAAWAAQEDAPLTIAVAPYAP